MCPIVVSLKSVRFVVFAALLAAGLMTFAPAAALAQAQFFAVGDLPGGSFSSQIRDATKHNGVIYAVGGGNGQASGCTDPCQILDTAILWRWDGTSASLTALPNLVVNAAATTPIIASAITPDGAYIASRARSVFPGGARQAVRVTTALVPFPEREPQPRDPLLAGIESEYRRRFGFGGRLNPVRVHIVRQCPPV